MKLPTDYAFLRGSLLTALLWLSAASVSQSSQPSESLELADPLIPEPPSNWYQVEIVLFTQQRQGGSESPSKDYRLQFPENWRELAQGNIPLSGISSPLVDDISATELLNGKAAFTVRNTPLFSTELTLAAVEETLDDPGLFRPIPEASIPYQHHQTETGELAVATETDLERPTASPEPFVPQYEEPYQILEAEYRDLNESAAALNRRQYNVVLHQAWRMPIDQSEASPWVLIKAGTTATSRYLIEGAVRFYKSRFLHFETNLWHLEFANDQSNWLQLPEIPRAPLSADQTVRLNAQVFSEQLASLSPVSTSPDHDDNPSVDQRAVDREYPVEAVWVMNKSQRLQQDQVYYLDHPEIGALVTIKAYVPPLLNPPSAAPKDSQSSEVTALDVISTERDAVPR
jgi:hypothetical protein